MYSLQEWQAILPALALQKTEVVVHAGIWKGKSANMSPKMQGFACYSDSFLAVDSLLS
jgi:hypothetical protein